MKLLLKFSAIASIAFATATASANFISVVNADFQTLPTGETLGPTQLDTGSIPGWTVSGSGSTGQWNPWNYGAFYPTALANLPYSSQPGPTNIIAYSNGATISQTVGATVQAGDEYVLTVDIGSRFDEAFTGSADLLINGHRYLAVGSNPATGSFTAVYATYTGTVADAGDAITIELRSSGDQGDFDNVILSGTPMSSSSVTPEPSSLMLMSTGGLTLCNLLRRRLATRRSRAV